MRTIQALLECFLEPGFKETASEETFRDYSFRAVGGVFVSIDREGLRNAIAHLPPNPWTLSVSLEGQESPQSLGSSDAASLETFLNDVGYGSVLSNKAEFYFYAAKPAELPHIYLFDPSVFYRWLNALPLTEALERFDVLVRTHSVVTFIHHQLDEPANTAAFCFTQSSPPLANQVEPKPDKAALIAARREQIVSDWSTSSLLPDDFRWCTQARIPEIQGTFARLENFLSVVSLSDSTTSDVDGFLVRVKGNVLREESVKWSQVPRKSDISLHNLYEWCYRTGAAGPLPDKLGLVRNFISLYWEFGIFNLDLRVVAAVRSGYALYLKQNLREFVELRAKVTSFILEIDAKVAKAVETATGNLEKNFYGLVTFVTSVVLLKILQDRTFSGAFTPQMAKLGAALIAISAIHALFARQSTLTEMKRAITLYDDLRAQYAAFFTLVDFDSIFAKGDKPPMKKTEEYLRSRLRSLMGVWFGTLAITSGVIYCLTR